MGTSTEAELRRPSAAERGGSHRWLVLGVIGIAQLMVLLDKKLRGRIKTTG